MRYASLSFTDENVTKKQCVNPWFNFSGLLFTPHSKSLIKSILPGNPRKASSIFLTSAGVVLSENLNNTTCRNIGALFFVALVCADTNCIDAQVSKTSRSVFRMVIFYANLSVVYP